MINLWTEEETPLKAKQFLVSPSIYLDHWAIRKLSESEALRTRFVDAVRGRNGTVAISWLNLVEFSRVFDGSHVLTAGEMIQSLYPNLFFIQVDPFTVISQEDNLVNQSSLVSPHADNKLLKEAIILKSETLCLFDAVRLFRECQESNMSGKYNSLVQTILRETHKLNETILDGTDTRLNLKKTQTSQTYRAGTRYILREIMRQIFLDRKTALKENDAIDLIHTVVPSSYCDIVLLDGRWRNLVERLIQSFKLENVSFTIAKPYSERGGGLGQFIDDLQNESIFTNGA